MCQNIIPHHYSRRVGKIYMVLIRLMKKYHTFLWATCSPGPSLFAYVVSTLFTWASSKLSHLMTQPTKWPLHPANTQINLGIRPVWSESCCPHEETLGPQLPIECTAKTLIRSDWADAWADLSLCWAHRSFCWFCQKKAQTCSSTLIKVQFDQDLPHLQSCSYRNVPKFSDRQVWANSEGPDQTAS